jgi:hypothetical protein
MTITKALRKLYRAIVGEDLPANVNSITKILVALAENWPSGSNQGPAA